MMNTKLTERKPHRQFCSICHEVLRIDFFVPDDVWELATHVSQRNNIICLRCFTRMADGRGVEWDRDIKFYPTSWITHQRSIFQMVRITETKEEYEEDRKFFDEMKPSLARNVCPICRTPRREYKHEDLMKDIYASTCGECGYIFETRQNC